ncbi:uncharacterized protein LOC119404461 [Rhipicephalus sanguineus]|uniref:uncharacterized protein LOC119404461 n=1 Tax=Rhipicephalus sanguineus TaxID=34632 RepID=UPI0020C31211|nr:uncharacterized protein LOC119404461 [Rhipicephalus sanguineus]
MATVYCQTEETLQSSPLMSLPAVASNVRIKVEPSSPGTTLPHVMENVDIKVEPSSPVTVLPPDVTYDEIKEEITMPNSPVPSPVMDTVDIKVEPTSPMAMLATGHLDMDDEKPSNLEALQPCIIGINQLSSCSEASRDMATTDSNPGARKDNLEMSSDVASSCASLSGLSSDDFSDDFSYDVSVEGSPFDFDPPSREPTDLCRTERIEQWQNEGCSCGECLPARSDEMLCCRSIPVVAAMLGGTTCICEHRVFPLLCLDGDLLEVSRRQLNFYNPTYLEGADRNSALRYTAYRLFVWWTWSSLGRENRQPLPGCVLRRIRNAFPSATYKVFSWV